MPMPWNFKAIVGAWSMATHSAIQEQLLENNSQQGFPIWSKRNYTEQDQGFFV